ncbi:hypothetical protein [Streptomyces sp. NPDC051214]|uniref:hypothetical protein n=1 Tax=Streptomyces sp. NPDC051214 TaxID=3155282 RepID=UPI003415E734
MNRPLRLATVALTATAALLLTACGSGDDESKDNDKIAGADKGGEKESASPTASEPAGVERPKIKLPSDVKLSFKPEQTGDTAKDAILRDNSDFIRALNAAIVAGDPRLPALEFFTEGEAAASSQNWVKAFKDAGWTVTGTVKYYNRQVAVKSKTAASLTYCGDESKGYSKVIKTGQVKRTKVTKRSYILYGAQVEKNQEGVWELVKITSTRGAAVCQP